jgi:hypothetical protein
MTGPRMASPKSPSERGSEKRDVALVHRVTEDGAVHVIRQRGDQLEAGALQPLREGAPIQGEVVSLKPRENFPLLCDVETLYQPPTTPASEAPRSRRKGPAQVATAVYRDNWDSIWNAKKSEQLN